MHNPVTPRVLAPLTLLSVLSLLACGSKPARAQNLMPLPAQMTRGTGRLLLPEGLQVSQSGYREARLDRAVTRFQSHLANRTGLAAQTADAGPRLQIDCRAAGAAVQALGEDESYVLDVTPAQAHLSAPQPLGILRGLETLLQLVEKGGSQVFVPAVHIEDRPRFPWRGLLLDVSRHFQPVENVKRTLDGMAAVKMNVLHWHLSDDQGFRVESRTFPKLHQVGSEGQYYTQAQVRDILAYARDRGIRILPEFDLPGHSSSWLAAYPQYGSGPGPYAIAHTWRVLEPTFNPIREDTYTFLSRFFAEMSLLFPDQYVHVGGDELNGREWKKNKLIQRFIKAHKLKNKAGLHGYFNKRLVAIITRYGKKPVGWDEVLQGDLPKSVVVQSWRGPRSLARAAGAGYAAIRSAGYYLDVMDPASKHYLIDPLDGAASDLAPEDQRRILGGEACMWAEYVGPEALDSRIWPRAAAIAERFWSPAEVRDLPSMYARLAGVSTELTELGLTHQTGYVPALQRLVGTGPVEPLKTLADVVEPLKHYARGRAAYERGEQDTVQIPLNRLVDAARPESSLARDFNGMVDRYLAGGPTQSEDAAWLRQWLVRWRDNDAALRPVLGTHPWLAEVVPLSSNLSALARLGLDALDRKELTADQKKELEDASQAAAEVTPAIASGIQRLAGMPTSLASSRQ